MENKDVKGVEHLPRMAFASARICNRAVSCFGELTESRGRSEGRH